MGKPHAVRKVHPVGVKQDDETAVTPVIGAVLILGITVLGIAGVLLWGAPLIDRIQSRNAQSAMVGEFEDLRDASRELSVPDHSRFPTVVLSRGAISLESGSRIMVTSIRDAGVNPNCDFHITNWADTATPGSVTLLSTSGCRSGATVVTYSVSGSTVVQVDSRAASSGLVITPSPAVDFSQGDWLFRLVDAGCTPDTYCAASWLLSTDRLQWEMEGTSGARSVSLDAGAIFSQEDGTTFLAKEPIIGDTAFGSSYYGLWLRTLTAATEGSLSGAGSHQVYLSLVGNHVRTDSSAVARLRFDISGDLAEAWCNSLLDRNDELTGASYKEDATMTCATGGADGVRSVCYARVDATLNACTANNPATFAFKFLHARIYTSLVV